MRILERLDGSNAREAGEDPMTISMTLLNVRRNSAHSARPQ
jgi:hypothetical protein